MTQKNTKILKTSLAALLMGIIGASPTTVFAQSGSTLSLTTSAQCLQSSQDVLLTVRLDGAVNASTVQTTITYDASVFDVSEKPQVGASFPLVFRNTTDAALGTIELSASTTSSVSGNTDFATIRLKSKKAASTVINFDKNATIVLGTSKENTNILGSTTNLTLNACSGTVNSNTNSTSSTSKPTPTTNTNSNSNSSWTNPGPSNSTACAEPENFAVKVKSDGILLSWTNTDPKVNGHVVHYGTSGRDGFDTAFLANDGNTQQTGNNFSLLLENVAAGKDYKIALSAVGNCAESGNTPTLKFTSGGTTLHSSAPVGTQKSVVGVKSARLNATLVGGTHASANTGPKEALIISFVIMMSVMVFYGVTRKSVENG